MANINKNEFQNNEFIVALDGPAGSGKSTIAKLLANKYGFTYLDTGAMYRLVTLKVIRDSIDIEDKAAVQNMLDNINIDIQGNKFYLDRKDVSGDIRTPEVTKLVSPVSAIREVREKMVALQRNIAHGKQSILDGRDIGTVVFPNADIKIYLIASPEVRAQRRYDEYKAKGIEQDYKEVLADIIKRDEYDSTRKESPLRKAEDAIELDSSHMAIDEVVAAISKYIDDAGIACK